MKPQFCDKDFHITYAVMLQTADPQIAQAQLMVQWFSAQPNGSCQ